VGAGAPGKGKKSKKRAPPKPPPFGKNFLFFKMRGLFPPAPANKLEGKETNPCPPPLSLKFFCPV